MANLTEIDTETNNNNTRERANSMNAGDTMNGKISAVNDGDCFKIRFAYASPVKMELSIPQQVNYRLRVFAGLTSDNAVAEDVSLTIGSLRTVTFTPNTTTDYYVVITPNVTNLFDASSNYALKVYYTGNQLVSDKLEGYRSTYHGTKYWNNKKTDADLSASNWQVTSTACPGNDVNVNCFSNKYGNAWQCAGFAFFMAKVVFNSAISQSVKDLTNGASFAGGWTYYNTGFGSLTLKPGDIIRKGPSDSSGHSAMVWKVDASGVYVVECLGSSGCIIWFGGFNKSSLPRSKDYMLDGDIVYVLTSPILKTL